MSDQAIEIMPQVVGGDALERIERANVDIQVATAHQYPRSMAVFKRRALEMVTLDEETAQSCIYRRPVGKQKNGQPEYAEGKSVRLAEIVGACYGNIRVAAILIEQTPRYVKARGMAHDLESNFASACEVIESTVTKEGNPFSERMRMVIAKACLAKARRDATFQVVPGALCKHLEEAARETAIGTTATLGKRRTLLLDWANKLGIEPARIYAAIGVKGLDDIGLAELETLTGLRTAIKEGDTTADEAFPKPDIQQPQRKSEGSGPAPTPEAKPAAPAPQQEKMETQSEQPKADEKAAKAAPAAGGGTGPSATPQGPGTPPPATAGVSAAPEMPSAADLDLATHMRGRLLEAKKGKRNVMGKETPYFKFKVDEVWVSTFSSEIGLYAITLGKRYVDVWYEPQGKDFNELCRIVPAPDEG